jgi:hypothetical protein
MFIYLKKNFYTILPIILDHDPSVKTAQREEKLASQRVIELYHALMFQYSVRWLYPEIATAFSNELAVMEIRMAEYYLLTNAATTLNEMYLQSYCNADDNLLAILGISVATLDGEAYVEEVCSHALERAQLRSYEELCMQRDVERQLNTMSEAEYEARIRHVTAEQIERIKILLKNWREGLSSSIQEPHEDDGLPVNNNIRAAWEVQEEPPTCEIRNDILINIREEGVVYDTTGSNNAASVSARLSGSSGGDGMVESGSVANTIEVPNDEVAFVGQPYVLPRRMLDYKTVKAINVGEMVHRCSACYALHFEGELHDKRLTYLICCRHGKVS